MNFVMPQDISGRMDQQIHINNLHYEEVTQICLDIRRDINTMKEDIKTMKEDITTIKGYIAGMKQDIDVIKNQQAAVTQTLKDTAIYGRL